MLMLKYNNQKSLVLFDLFFFYMYVFTWSSISILPMMGWGEKVFAFFFIQQSGLKPKRMLPTAENEPHPLAKQNDINHHADILTLYREDFFRSAPTVSGVDIKAFLLNLYFIGLSFPSARSRFSV